MAGSLTDQQTEENNRYQRDMLELRGKLHRMELEYNLLQRECSKKDVRGRGLERDVLRLQAALAVNTEELTQLRQVVPSSTIGKGGREGDGINGKAKVTPASGGGDVDEGRNDGQMLESVESSATDRLDESSHIAASVDASLLLARIAELEKIVLIQNKNQRGNVNDGSLILSDPMLGASVKAGVSTNVMYYEGVVTNQDTGLGRESLVEVGGGGGDWIEDNIRGVVGGGRAEMSRSAAGQRSSIVDGGGDRRGVERELSSLFLPQSTHKNLTLSDPPSPPMPTVQRSLSQLDNLRNITGEGGGKSAVSPSSSTVTSPPVTHGTYPMGASVAADIYTTQLSRLLKLADEAISR